MIYPKTIFRTVIALSTVAATTPATVASHRHPAHGDKRGKNGRYIDTTTNFYGTTATDALNVASPSSYIAAAGNPQVGVKLRKVTSPSNTGVMFSSASPTNAVTAAVNGYTNGKSGYVTVAKGYGSSPILSTRTLDYQGGREAVVNGGKGSVGTHTPPKPCTKGKKAHHGGDGATPGAPNGKASLKGSSGGHYDGANAPVSHKDGQGKQGLKTGENRDYGAPAHSHHQGEKSKKGSKPSTRGNNGGDVPSTGHTKAKGKKQAI
ncbi:hypothetical protein KRP22_010039 [Phytophthora ramorum]|nr:hypothetical protein KRP22_10212 [Phytophthora ramorum]